MGQTSNEPTDSPNAKLRAITTNTGYILFTKVSNKTEIIERKLKIINRLAM